MAHNLTERDQMFTVREAAWHGLGEVLPEHPTREEAQRIAHNWEPISEPLYRGVPTITDEGELETRYEEVEGWKGNVRSDTNHMLGVTSDTYELVGNNEMYEIAEALEGESGGSVQYETGGSLKGGSKVWLLVRLQEPLKINNDPLTATIPYYSLQNAHDGSGSFRGQATMTRIVCDNTAQMADFDARQRGTEFTFRHSKNVKDRISEARVALTGWRESVENWQRMNEMLLASKVDASGLEDFIEQFIEMPKAGTVSQRVTYNVLDARNQLRDIINGETCEGIGHTAYGLVQGSIEYAQHYRKANGAESRFKRAYLDKSRLTSDALKIAMEVSA